MKKIQFQTPILYLVFNRLDVVKKTFPIIAKQKPEYLFIGADGPRTKEEKKKTDAVREYILENINWKCNVKIKFPKKNLGCKEGVSTAVDWFFENVEQGIILEDDCVPSKSFFRFSEEMLERYKNKLKVMSICGYNYLEKIKIKESYYFSKYFECLGWSSWRDRWQKRDETLRDYLSDEKSGKLKKIINNPIERILIKKKIKDNLRGRIEAWDHSFEYLHFKNKGICIRPKVNLVENIGFMKDSTHTSGNFIDNKFYCIDKFELKFPLIHPNKTKINYKISSKEFNKNILRLILKKIFWFAI